MRRWWPSDAPRSNCPPAAPVNKKATAAELTALQHAQHVTERKKVWEAIYPETKHGGVPGAGKGKGKKKVCKVADSATLQNDEPAESFVAETAKATQAAPRTIRESAQIGNKICRKAQTLLAGTPVEDRKTDLLRSEAGGG